MRAARNAGLVVICALLSAPIASAAVTLPDQTILEKVDFERHIMGLLGRMGCNASSCHGSFKGQGGFRLSLFGSDLEKDYAALSDDGRRITRDDPDASLLLLKPTKSVNHGGGQRFEKNSWQYQLLQTWIKQGARWDKGSGAIARMTIDPPEYAFTRSGETGQLKVRAKFNNGQEENISTFCNYRSNNEAVAEVFIGEFAKLIEHLTERLSGFLFWGEAATPDPFTKTARTRTSHAFLAASALGRQVAQDHDRAPEAARA